MTWPTAVQVLPPIDLTLAARPVAGVNPLVPSLGFPFQFSAPTIIEVFSGAQVDPFAPDAYAFNVLIQSTAGGLPGPLAAFTVQTSARVCLFGNDFVVSFQNLSLNSNRVRARAFQVPSMLPTENVFQQVQALPGSGNTVAFIVPNLATRVRFDVPASQQAAVVLEILAGSTGTPVIASYAWDEQPSQGIPVGGGSALRIRNGSAAENVRVTYFLQV